MAKNRIIVSTIRLSQSFAELNYRQRDLWHGLIAVADDQGRMPGVPAVIRAMVWPYEDISVEEVESDLFNLEALGMITRYQRDGKRFLQIVNWWRYQKMQWAGESAYPPPQDWTDRCRYTGPGRKIITKHWEDPGGFPTQTKTEHVKENENDNEGVNDKDNDKGENKDNKLDEGVATDKGADKARNKGAAVGADKGAGKGSTKGVAEDAQDRELSPPAAAPVFSAYEANIGSLTPHIIESIGDYLDEGIPPAWLVEAFNIAAENNKQAWSYSKAIVDRWKREGKDSGRGRQTEEDRKHKALLDAIYRYERK